jgi:hypothetical protein
MECRSVEHLANVAQMLGVDRLRTAFLWLDPAARMRSTPALAGAERPRSSTERGTVLMSKPSRRAISFFGTSSTRCIWRISAHCDTLFTSWPSASGTRNERHIRSATPPRGPLPALSKEVPFQRAAGALFRVPPTERPPSSDAMSTDPAPTPGLLRSALGLPEEIRSHAAASSSL